MSYVQSQDYPLMLYPVIQGSLPFVEDMPAEITARLWLGDTPSAAAARAAPARAVLAEGFQGISQFFRDKGPEWVKAYGGWGGKREQ